MGDSVLDIMRQAGITDAQIVAIQGLGGGRVWYIPKRDFNMIREQILADPCRDIRTIVRRYKVSREFVYRVWRAA